MAIGLPLPSRAAAGRLRADLLAPLCPEDNLLVLTLPRGGAPVGFEIAQALRAAFDVLLVRKLGAPSNPELALGAIAARGIQVMNDDVAVWAYVALEVLSAAVQTATLERQRRHRPRPPLAGRTVVLVDDGTASGADLALRLHGVFHRRDRFNPPHREWRNHAGEQHQRQWHGDAAGRRRLVLEDGHAGCPITADQTCRLTPAQLTA
jgi:adenine/guanine phosphoribosyltransferase-like PRPP-binding protein